jgi:diguanylate cyclase (GGDEF)-like protein
MKYQKFFHFLQHAGKDPETLYFEDELTELKNRRFLLDYLQHQTDWGELSSRPLSLLMIDADYLRQMNDQYGQEAGDQALLHISNTIRQTIPPHGVAVRYAGDEFVVLLPDTVKEGARVVAENLLKQIHYNLFFAADSETPIPLTLSIGYATAPDDAKTAKGLLHQADLALYVAKQGGKNRHVDTADVVPEAVSHKTAIHHLDNAGIVGRKSQFEVVGDALKRLGRGQNGFLIVDGAPGMGKTSFLDLVRRNLEKKNVNLVHVAGVLQESYRPYYLIAYIAMAMMRQLPDKGLSILDTMDERSINLVAHIIPQLIGLQDPRPEDNPAHREAIFHAFADFFAALLDKRPLVLLADDLDYCDAASLHLMEAIFKQQRVPMLVCGTASEDASPRPQAVPLQLFRNAYAETLGIRTIALTGLAAEGIEKHVKMIFPGIDLPRKMAKELAAVTEGNPLFVVAVLRKMVDDAKIFHKGGKWRIGKLERNYFPHSLDEIIQQKKSLLDEESRRFIDRASAFGESMSLSMLAGFTKEHSSKIYDYINEAQAQGLVRSEFVDADENIRFSGKLVQEAIYSDIPEEIKQEIQARIGYYKEDLYKRDLLASSAILSHHFSQSGDSEKARAYEKLQSDYNRRLFNGEEARAYIGSEEDESREGDAASDTPLGPTAKSLAPGLLREMVVTARNVQLYPPESRSVNDSLNRLLHVLQQMLAENERVSVICDKGSLLINQQAVDTSALPRIAEALSGLLDRLQLQHLTFIRGLRAEELSTLMQKLGQVGAKSITAGFWGAFLEEHALSHIRLGQVRYEKLRTEAETATPVTPGAAGGEEGSDAAAFLDAADLQTVQQIIANLMGAVNRLKLYPSGGPVTEKAIHRFYGALEPFLQRKPRLTLSRVEKSLLANGMKLDISGFETLAASFLRFYEDAGIESITFLSGLGTDETTRFITFASRIEEEGDPAETWQKAASGISPLHIRVNEGVYGIRVLAAGEADTEDKTPPARRPVSAPADRGKGAALQEIDPKDLPEWIRDMFLSGELDTARSLLEALAESYHDADEPSRKEILARFDEILSPGDWRPNAAYVHFVIAPFMQLLAAERQPSLLNRAAATCYQAAQDFISFGEYSLAAWIMTRIHTHPLAESIQPMEMQATVLENLVNGLSSGDRELQQSAFQLLSSLGSLALPHLINMIKRDNPLQARRLAAELVRHHGGEGETLIKRTLMNEHIPEERARILDVLDTVTTDIQVELFYAISDFKQVVRQAAGRLAERNRSQSIVEMLVQAARGEVPDTAVTAVNILGRLKALEAADTLIELLDQAEDEELLIAICRAMGQIGDEAFVLPLQNILRSRRSLLFRKTRSSQVRVAAAYAVSQIDDQRSPRILQALLDDADPHLREVARTLTR